jgi:lipopolysaccharide transport system permease protein
MSEISIESGSVEREYWHDLWRYRELLYFLAWRDILVRYKQTVIGIFWALIRPMLTMAILTVVFGRIAQMPSNGIPYPILVFTGMLPWQFFATAFSESSNSVVLNSGMISKVYFPRIVIPMSSVITSMVDFVISFAIMMLILFYYQYNPNIKAVFLPLFIILVFATAFGAGLWVSALMVRYRDFKYIIPFIIQFGLYISPVGFSSSVIPEKWNLIYILNPMVGIIDGFRWAILNDYPIQIASLISSVLSVTLIILSGIWYFRKTEKEFADII